MKLRVPTRITGRWIASTAMAEKADEQALEDLVAALRERNWHSLDAVEIVVRAMWKEARAFHAQVASEAKAHKARSATKGVKA